MKQTPWEPLDNLTRCKEAMREGERAFKFKLATGRLGPLPRPSPEPRPRPGPARRRSGATRRVVPAGKQA